MKEFRPEVQFLGRSLPILQQASHLSLLAGGMIGVRSGRPIKGGIVGGFTGLGAGMVAGNLIEQERQAKMIENQMDNPQY